MDLQTAIQVVTMRDKLPVLEVFSNVIKGFATTTMSDAVKRNVLDNQLVHSVEENLEVELCAQEISWNIERIGALQSVTAGISSPASYADKNEVHMFLLDSGVSENHPDLNVVETMSFSSGEVATDFIGHGTGVAGIIAAKDNDSNVVGICSGASIHSYKVVKHDGTGTFASLIKALDKVVTFKPNLEKMAVIVGAIAFTGSTSYTVLDQAVRSAVLRYNIPIVVPAGNHGVHASLFSPAHVSEAITVGSYTESNTLSEFSNFGIAVDLLAPGESIHTLFLKSKTAICSGTSFAAAHVVGAVGLYLLKHPNANPCWIKESIVSMTNQSNPQDNPNIMHARRNTTIKGIFIAEL